MSAQPAVASRGTVTAIARMRLRILATNVGNARYHHHDLDSALFRARAWLAVRLREARFRDARGESIERLLRSTT